MRCTSLFLSALTAAFVAGHGDIAKERAASKAFFANNKRDLGHCADAIKARGLEDRNVMRRRDIASSLIEKRGLVNNKARALTSLNESHHSDKNYTPETPEEVIFMSNGSCVLMPEVTDGPYYVAGEHIRSNTTEGQEGVGVHLELQFLDMETCEPVQGAYAEIWGANATGVYSGVEVSGNGNGTGDPSNLNRTFLRGVQETDPEGVVQFDTIVPGYYSGRTNHIHVMVHLNVTPAENGTLTDKYASHVGQMFFDQGLVDEVMDMYPYNTNDQSGLTNAEDDVVYDSALWSDPFLEYVMLGDSLEDGLFGWLSVAINTTYNAENFVAAYLTEDGGHETDEEYTDWWNPNDPICPFC